MTSNTPKENPWTRMRLEREQAQRAWAAHKGGAQAAEARPEAPHGGRPARTGQADRAAQARRDAAPQASRAPGARDGRSASGARRTRDETGRNRADSPFARSRARETIDGREALAKHRPSATAAQGGATRQSAPAQTRRTSDTPYSRRRGERTAKASPAASGAAGAHPADEAGRRAHASGAGGARRGRTAPERAFDILSGIPPRLMAIGACALVALIAAALLIASLLGGGKEDEAPAAQPEPASEAPAAQTADFTPSPAALDAVPSGSAIQTFSLSGLSAPEMDADALPAIEQAVSAASAHGSVGFVFYDLESGRGIACDADATVYGASSFKAPYAVYVCEELVEDGTISLSTMCPVSYALDPGSYYGNSGDAAYPVGDLIQAAIIDSDNNAFGFLRDSYDSMGFDAWVESVGADDAAYTPDSWFPWYCARSSAKLWTEAYDYLGSGTETAQWLADVMEQTETSFIRDGLARCPGGADAVMRNKAGWCADADPDYDSVSDAGIIEADGHAYIMCIMTGMPDSDENRSLVADIAAALFGAREALDLQA